MTQPPDHSRGFARSTAEAAGWESTRVQTQIAPRPNGGPGDVEAERDIGRAVGQGLRELFVVCEPGEALRQQFEFLQPEFIAVHDLSTNASRKLLGGIAAASQGAVQRLVIRRAGGGTTLATLEFVDVPAANGGAVRLYSTTVEADTASRQAMARVLLGHSLLGLMLVGELPAHALASGLAPWREAALEPGWSCHRLLFLPLAAGAALPAEIARFRAATRIDATTTPQVSRPAEVWAQLCTAWNALLHQRNPGRDAAQLPLLSAAEAASTRAAASVPARAVAPASAAPLISAAQSAPTPMPVIGARVPSSDAPLERYLHDLSVLPGVVSACAFDIATGRPIGHAGARPGPDELGRHGNALLASMMSASRAMGLGASVPDVTITLGQHHLLLRQLAAHPGAALHLVVDKPHATLSLVQLQLRRFDEELVRATKAAGPALQSN